ncbi:MAG: HDIG domain-containing metalloprotein [Cyanobacteria bacterium P01_F01_bin.42]
MSFLSRLNPRVYRDWFLALTIRPAAPQRSTIQKSVMIVGCAVLVLTGAFGSRFYSEPVLVEGVIAPETLTAPRLARVEDPEKTAERRAAELRKARIYYKVAPSTTADILTALSNRLIEASTLRQISGAFPYSDLLPLPYQRALRNLDSQALADALQQIELATSRPDGFPVSADVWQALKTIQTQDDAQWQDFVNRALAAQRRYQTALNTSSVLLDSQTKVDVLDVSDAQWREASPNLRQVGKIIVTQGIPTGLADNILKNTVAEHLSGTAEEVQTLGQSLLLPILKPNLENDPLGTARERQRILRDLTPVEIEILKGQTIVRQGQIISREQFLILEELNLSRREINWRGLGSILLGGSVAIAIFHLVHRLRTQIPLSRRDYLLLVILSVTSPVIISLSLLEFTSLPAIGLLVGSLYGPTLGGTTVVLITAVTALGLDTGFAQLLAIAVGSFVGSVLARQPRSREELALLGLIIAVLQALLYFIFLSLSAGLGYEVFMTAVRQGILGLVWSIATLGISPYIEKLFDLVTPIRLAELANPNRPLLKRLAMETPGTYQHTLFVSTLAEAGARALNCDVELVRTGTLYHDIGKMHYPAAFIENQFACDNVHEQLQDPWASAELIKKHVSEGLVMAKKYHLPSAVAAFIPEHQGTILVAYFYHQAQQGKADNQADNAVQEQDFRYTGPIPQRRETGIVMLADACEAALRSLAERDTDAAFNMIEKIFKARWQDGQLRESALTQDDLKVLAQVFVEVWGQFHHQRIAYPSQLSTGN